MVFDTDICGICREAFNDNKYKLQCGHVFHRVCILEWTLRVSQCPYCRCQIDELMRLDKIYTDEELLLLMRTYEFADIATSQELSDNIRRAFMNTICELSFRREVISIFSNFQELDAQFIVDFVTDLELNVILERAEELSLSDEIVSLIRSHM